MSNRTPYVAGQTMRCSGVFKNALRQNADPTTITFKFRRLLDAATTTYVYGINAQLVKDATGLYHVDIALTKPGVWSYRFESTGDPATAGERQVIVSESDFILT